MATQRGYNREEIIRAINNISMALNHLVRLIPLYAEAHPEIAEVLDSACEGLTLIAETMQKLHDSI